MLFIQRKNKLQTFLLSSCKERCLCNLWPSLALRNIKVSILWVLSTTVCVLKLFEQLERLEDLETLFVKEAEAPKQRCVTLCCCLVAQKRASLCNPTDYSPPGSSVRGVLQARTLQWVAFPSSRGSSQPWHWTRISCISRRIFFNRWAPRESWVTIRNSNTGGYQTMYQLPALQASGYPCLPCFLKPTPDIYKLRPWPAATYHRLLCVSLSPAKPQIPGKGISTDYRQWTEALF